MKTVLASLILMFCVVSAFATANAFVTISEGVKYLNSGKDSSQEVILGHRVTSQGQFVLVK